MKQKGFTLIELLVVVAIIGILAAVGVVAYNGYTESAKSSTVKSTCKSVEKFIRLETTKCSAGLTDWIFGQNAMIEEFIPGRELTVTVMGDRPLAVTEVITGSQFYNYETKRKNNSNYWGGCRCKF